MPLPMQGDKLLPCRKRVVRRSLRPRPPDRRRGNGLLNAGRGWRKSPPLELGSLGVAEVDCSELLQMLVQQPRVIDHRLQDERLARRNRSAAAAMNRARRKLRARRHITLAGKQTRGALRTPRSRLPKSLGPLT